MAFLKDLTIGVDSSTSACKVLIFDPGGRVVSSGKCNLEMVMPHPGWHEQDAGTWWRAFKRATRQALQAIDVGRLSGLAIAHQRETFVPVDANGRPLRSGILWMDERAAGELDEIEKRISRAAFHTITGKPLSANLTAAKIAWLRKYEPAVFRQTVYFLDVHAFLAHCLTGEFCTSWGSADPTGLFAMQEREWSVNILEAVGADPASMPRVVCPGNLIGMVTRKAAQETGLPAGLPIIAGLGDGQAGGVGVNICQPGTSYLTLGTSVISGSFSPVYLTNPAFRTMFGGGENSFLLETVLLGGTYTIEWLLKDLFGKKGPAALRLRQQLELEMLNIPAGSDGLMLVPYWNSVMNPYWDATASGIVVGWRGGHGPAHLYRALLEGISFELRLHFEGVENSLGNKIESVVAMGGGARSDAWCQMIATITGKPLQRSTADEAAATGAAVLAAAGSGLYPSIPAAAQAMSASQKVIFYPDPEQAVYYSGLYEHVYRDLYPNLRESLTNLAKIRDHRSV